MGKGRITTRGRVARTSSTTRARDGSSFCRWASGSCALRRWCTPSARAARSASAARVPASPRVPVSPCVKSRMPTRWPACAAFASVPPPVSSTSSRCAAIANKSTRCSLIAEGLHRIESRRPVGGHDTEDHADEDGDEGRDGGAPQRDGRREAEQRLEDFARGETEYDADHAAHERERRGLDEELPQDFPAGRAHRFAEPDLARAVGDGDHHDGHDPDAAHHQRDAREHEHDEEERGGEAVEDAQHLVRRQQVETVGFAHPDPPHAAQLQRDGVHRPGHADAGHRPHEKDQPVHLVEQGEGLGAAAPVLEPMEQLRPDRGVVDLGEAGDRLRLLRLEDRALPDLAGKGVGVDGRLREESQHAERRRADDLQGLHDLLAKPRDDRGHGHHGRDPDHDTQHREARAGLVGAQLLERDQPALADGVEPHSARSAAMGSSRDARVAGYTPNSTPTVSPRPSATPTDHPVTRAGSGVTAPTTPASVMPAARPSTPPTSERVTDSARNWRRLARRVAPRDLRIPISRVRSVTLMSMMFMITIPPTTMPMATTAGTTVKMTRVRLCQKEMSPSAVSTEKSSSWPGRSRCAIRMASSAPSMASATWSAAGLLTEITVVGARPSRASNVVRGSITNPSHDCPSTVPFFAMTPLIVNVQPRTRTRWPTARATSSNSFSATSNPRIATRRRCCTSTSVSGSPAAIW